MYAETIEGGLPALADSPTNNAFSVGKLIKKEQVITSENIGDYYGDKSRN
jgi:hypothetical protein